MSKVPYEECPVPFETLADQADGVHELHDRMSEQREYGMSWDDFLNEHEIDSVRLDIDNKEPANERISLRSS